MECPVCMNEMDVDYLIPCEHPLCKQCAAQWFIKKPICPTCRQHPAKYTSNLRLDRNIEAKNTAIMRWYPVGLRLHDISDHVYVLDVVHDQAAHKAGIRKGDCILFVNGFPIKSYSDVIGIVKSAESSKNNVVIVYNRFCTSFWKCCYGKN